MAAQIDDLAVLDLIDHLSLELREGLSSLSAGEIAMFREALGALSKHDASAQVAARVLEMLQPEGKA